MLTTTRVDIVGDSTSVPYNTNEILKPVLDFHYTQKSIIDQAQKLNYNFLFSIDNPVMNSKGKFTKKFSACKDIKTFLSYYNTINDQDKHFYETVHSKFYEFYDLDLTIPSDSKDPSIFTNFNLFSWFDSIRSEFIKFIFISKTESNDNPNFWDYNNNIKLNFLSKPDWIITTASDQGKLSLHLVNRNATFDDNTVFKKFYSSFNSYI